VRKLTYSQQVGISTLVPVWLLLYRKKCMLILQSLFDVHTLEEQRTVFLTNAKSNLSVTHVQTHILIFFIIRELKYLCEEFSGVL
jgi:hypothetical protein